MKRTRVPWLRLVFSAAAFILLLGTAAACKQADTASDVEFTQITATSPANGLVDIAKKITKLDWADVTTKGAVSYDLYLGLNGLPAAASGLTVSEWTITTAPLAAGTYSWKVVAKDASGAASEGAVWTFKVTDGSDVFGSWETRIPDANFRTAIEKIVGKTFGSITFGDIAAVTDLKIQKASIANISGINYFTQITRVLLGNNQIIDVSQLADIDTLKYIGGANNKIADLSPLLKLSTLKGLWFPNNPLDWTNISLMKPANFPNLDSLGFDGQDESSNTYIVTTSQAISILEPYKNSIRWLGLRAFQMGDSGFTTLYDSVISANFSNYKSLEAGKLQLTNASLTLIANLTALTEAYLYSNQFTDISALTTLTALNICNVDYNKLTSLAPLKTLYDTGAFHASGAYINVQGNNLDLRTGTADRIVVDYLIAAGVTVDYATGNTTQ